MHTSKIAILFVIFSLSVALSQAERTFRVLETDLVTLMPTGYDPDHDNITYSYSRPFNRDGQWQTDYGDAGEYNVSIVASDGQTRSTETITLQVQKKNRSPIALQNKILIHEGDTLDLRKYIEDADQDDLTYTFEPPFSREGIWRPDFDSQGERISKVIVSDGQSNASVRLKIEVMDVNQPPEIEDTFNKNLVVSVMENQTIQYYLKAKDKDDDTLTYRWALDGKTISTEEKGELYLNFESAGEHLLSVSVQDSNHTLNRTWTVQVLDVNRLPQVSLLPISVREGEEVVLDLPEKDADNDTLKYGFSAPFASDGKWQTTYSSAGVYFSPVIISDGKDSITEKIKVTVLDVDIPPQLHLPEKLEVDEDKTLVWQIDVYDEDDEATTITLANLPQGAAFDAQTKTLTWRPGYDAIARRGGFVSSVLNAVRVEQKFLDEQAINLDVKACGKEKCSTGTVALIVRQVNRPPVLTPFTNLTLEEGGSVQLTAKASDPDGDILRYYYSAPARQDGIFSADSLGSHKVLVTASDGLDSHTLPVYINVIKKNVAPQLIVSRAEYQIQEGKELQFQVSAADANNDSVILTAENLPRGATFKDGTFSFTPGYGFTNLSETVWVKLYASDDQVSTMQLVKITVENNNREPQIEEYYPRDSKIMVVAGANQDFRIRVTDEDKDHISYRWDFGSGEQNVQGTDHIQRIFKYPGEKKVRVMVTDGHAAVAQEWKVIVQAPEQPQEEPPLANIKVYYIQR